MTAADTAGLLVAHGRKSLAPPGRTVPSFDEVGAERDFRPSLATVRLALTRVVASGDDGITHPPPPE
jgi:hypothetical protein